MAVIVPKRLSQPGWKCVAKRKEGRFLAENSGLYFRSKSPGVLEICHGKDGNSGYVSLQEGQLSLADIAGIIAALSAVTMRILTHECGCIPTEKESARLPKPPLPPLPEGPPPEPKKRGMAGAVEFDPMDLSTIPLRSLTDKEIEDAILRHASYLVYPSRKGSKRFKVNGERLTGYNFDVKQLSGASFQSAKADKCTFRDADLAGADFRSTNLDGSDFTGAKGLEKATFSGATGVPIGLSSLCMLAFANHGLPTPAKAPSGRKHPQRPPTPRHGNTSEPFNAHMEHLRERQAGAARERLTNDRGDGAPPRKPKPVLGVIDSPAKAYEHAKREKNRNR